MSTIVVPPPDTSDRIVSILMAEYETVKAEQKSRISDRDNYLWVAGGAMLTTAAGALQFHQLHLLLAVPVICFTIGVVYLSNDQKVSAAGSYVRNRIAPRFAAITGDPDVLGWEWAKDDDGRAGQRRLLWTATNALIFVMPSVVVAVVLGVSWLHAPGASRAELVVRGAAGAVEAGAVLLSAGVMAWQIVVTGRTPHPRTRL